MPSPREEKIRPLLTQAQAVVDAVTLDDSGMMVGGIWVGGNGGLLSRDTLKAVDALRKTVMAVKAELKEEERLGK